MKEIIGWEIGMFTEGVRNDVYVGGVGGVGFFPRACCVIRLPADGVEHHGSVWLDQVEHDVAHAKVSHFVPLASGPARFAHMISSST